MAEAIIKDKKRILPCAAYCNKEYGVGGYFVGVPCVLGAAGVEKVIEVKLNDDERRLFANSVSHVKELGGGAGGVFCGWRSGPCPPTKGTRTSRGSFSTTIRTATSSGWKSSTPRNEWRTSARWN